MVISAANQAQVQQAVDGAVEVLTRLLALLEDETERLKTRKVDGLDQLLSEKLSAVQTLERIDLERQGALRAAGFTADPAGMREFLAMSQNPQLQAPWQRLTELLQRVQIINEANGTIIHRSLDQVGRQLALLRGESAPASSVYGPSGTTQQQSGGREISRA
jgi:flagella synthesis protein FlgN